MLKRKSQSRNWLSPLASFRLLLLSSAQEVSHSGFPFVNHRDMALSISYPRVRPFQQHQKKLTEQLKCYTCKKTMKNKAFTRRRLRLLLVYHNATSPTARLTCFGYYPAFFNLKTLDRRLPVFCSDI